MGNYQLLLWTNWTYLKVLAQECSYFIPLISVWRNHTLWLKATLGADRADGDGFAKLIILINDKCDNKLILPFKYNVANGKKNSRDIDLLTESE